MAYKGDVEATYASNLRKEKMALEAGRKEDAYGHAAENMYIKKNSAEIEKAGEMVQVPNDRPGYRPQRQEIDAETATEIREIKSGDKLPSDKQAKRLETYAGQKNKKLVLVYNPKKHPTATRRMETLRDKYGFELTP